MLKIEHLSRHYGDKIAVDDLNLYIAPVKFTVLSAITVQARQRR